MIKLRKTAEPDILSRNKNAWTIDYMSYVTAGTRIPKSLHARYRHAEIKTALKKETNDKCAYCESKVTHIDWGDVEHINPKENAPEKTYEWNNLTLSCTICNNSKGTYFSTTNPLINPYADNPSNHLRAFGPMIFGITGSTKGDTTEHVIKLNRTELIERRSETIASINFLIESWGRETDPLRKGVLWDQLKEETESNKEYSFAIRQYILDKTGISL